LSLRVVRTANAYEGSEIADMASTQVTIAEVVPLLRRFARALIGRRDIADDYVVLSLERFAAEGPAAAPADVRLALLRLLYEALFDHPPEAVPPADGLPAVVMRLPLPHRAALLLHALEEASYAEIAAVLGVAETGAARLYREALGAVRRFCFGNVLVIEFDGRHARYLTRLVRKAGYTVIGTATSRDEAIALTARTSPGLIVADAGGASGADTFGWLENHWSVPIVLVGARPGSSTCGSNPGGHGAHAAMDRPCQPQALRDALARVMPA
jgi:DNA-directed RNA polymerase specialized sigma24 family protein